ncbi:MAG: Ig-like domain-containing protein [Bacteroidales bacterium]|nr:Ig-like domain-containing protein [Bacteroidales bacterium]
MQPHSKEMSRLRYATLDMTALRGVGKECRGEAERSRGIPLLIEKTKNQIKTKNQKNMKKILLIAAIIGIVLTAATSSCKKKDKSVPVTDIMLSQTSATMVIGDTLTLTATVLPTNATDQTVSWTSSAANIATVENGKIIALSEGATAISVTTENGNKTAICLVTVTKATPPDAKTVSIGTQVGTLTAGVVGTATFAVTTENIANGATGLIQFYTTVEGTTPYYTPTGTSVTVSTVSNNAATVTVSTTTASLRTPGAFFRVIFDSVQSNVATLVIADGGSITIGSQTGTITAGTAGSATFSIATTGMGGGPPFQLKWYNTSGTEISTPTGLSAASLGFPMSTLTLNATAAAEAGTYKFRLLRNEVLSNEGMLTIGETSSKTVTVGAQNAPITAGVVGLITFPVTTSGIANGMYTSAASVANLPADISCLFVVINNNAGTLTLGAGSEGVANTIAGTYNTLRLTLDGAQSNVFTLTIVPGGDGSASNPFIVNNVATLQKVGSGTDGWTLDKNYRQTANINLSGVTWTPIGNSTTPFTGIYDGGGFSISNLSLTASAAKQGLFGQIRGAAVGNIALRNANITSTGEFTGGIVGFIESGNVRNCYVTGTIKGTSRVGGIAGETSGMILDCYTTCNVTGTGMTVGGIVGNTFGSSAVVKYCYATGQISGENFVGGIVGYSNTNTLVENNVAMNSRVAASPGSSAGRVIGDGTGLIRVNYARAAGMTLTNGSGAVTPTSSTTGLHGANVAASNTNGVNSGTTGWWPQSSGGPSFSTDHWNLAANRLPHLKTTIGGTFAETQNSTP